MHLGEPISVRENVSQSPITSARSPNFRWSTGRLGLLTCSVFGDKTRHRPVTSLPKENRMPIASGGCGGISWLPHVILLFFCAACARAAREASLFLFVIHALAENTRRVRRMTALS